MNQLMEAKKMEKKQTKEFKHRSLDVVQDKVYGIRKKDSKLYMVIWQRVANSGITYVWADDENNAYDKVGFNPKYVKHTIVKIDPQNMPVTVGVEG